MTFRAPPCICVLVVIYQNNWKHLISQCCLQGEVPVFICKHINKKKIPWYKIMQLVSELVNKFPVVILCCDVTTCIVVEIQ